jgi:hypothetical protein
METAIVVVAAVLTAGWYLGSNAQWWFRKLILFGMIRGELSHPYLFQQYSLQVDIVS